jgi:hypothetical protein
MDERLPDYFEEVPAAEAAARTLPGFLSEKIVCLKGMDIGSPDLDFLGQVSFPQTWEMKKFRFDALLDERLSWLMRRRRFAHVRKTAFGGDGRKARKFVRELRKISDAVDRMLATMLPGLKPSEVIKIARFSETRMENLHYDLDPGADDHEAFRLYINIDSAPRIWCTSYQISPLTSRLAAQRDLSRFQDQPAEMLAKDVTTRVFGGWHERATDRAAPRHFVYFDPGDVWVVDGRSVAHQVLFGHRVISIYVKLPLDANPGLQTTYGRKLRNAAASPIVDEPLPLYGSVAEAENVKETWTTVFGDTATGGIRRFGRRGMVTPAV